MKEKFIESISSSYNFQESESLTLGAAMLSDDETFSDAKVLIPYKMFNRHGLISGATGTGKTKTVQIIAEQLSQAGVPSVLMDLKGDMSGISIASTGHPKIDERHKLIGVEFKAQGSPTEFLTISGGVGTKLRATLLEFGPVLFSKILQLNATQTGVVSVIFKYCDDQGLALIDLEDFKEVLRFVGSDGNEEFEKLYGQVSSASISTILRKVVELEEQGADIFMGEPSFEVEDFLKQNKDGQGMVHILKLEDIQNKPKLFSTFMLSLLAEIYMTFPEQGDLEKPKLCLFIDEAHLVFDQASDALIEQLEQIVRLIRSKGVGVFFCTQNPSDVPENVLSQLGLKVQHGLRAFTAKDREKIKKTAQNFPVSDFYKVDQVITELGIGEAFVTALDLKGRPTPLVRTMLRAPVSRMGTLTEAETSAILSQSNLISKYNKEIDRESAKEILLKRIESSESESVKEVSKKEEQEESSGWFSALSDSTLFRQVARTVTREVTRGLLGAVGLRSTRKRRRRRRY